MTLAKVRQEFVVKGDEHLRRIPERLITVMTFGETGTRVSGLGSIFAVAHGLIAVSLAGTPDTVPGRQAL